MGGQPIERDRLRAAAARRIPAARPGRPDLRETYADDDEGPDPAAPGNGAVKDGSRPKIMGSALEALKAEAAYFVAEDGMRTGLFFFEMTDSSEIPPAAEPMFQGLEANITFAPVMNPQEMQAGVAKLTDTA